MAIFAVCVGAINLLLFTALGREQKISLKILNRDKKNAICFAPTAMSGQSYL